MDRELEQLATLENRRRRLIPELEGLKRDQNAAGDEVARAKRQGKDASAIFDANRQRSQQIRQLGIELDQVEYQRSALLLGLPNIPHASVPQGKSEADNVVVRTWGEPRQFDFDPQAHWDLGPALGILDFERATKMSGSRFAVLFGAGARLSRALTDFMLDLHTREHGYLEVAPPYLVNRASLEATGQLPKFEADLFKIARRVGSVSHPDGGSAADESPSQRNPQRRPARRSNTLRTRRAFAARPAHTVRTSEASFVSISSRKWKW